MSDNVIKIDNLSRKFAKKVALDDVTIHVQPGTVFGLVGENGAGKTTLIKHILGLLRAKTGSVSVFGFNPVQNPVEVLGRVGYLSEDRDLPEWMRINELMRYNQPFYPKWDEAYAEELRETFELDGKQKIKTLSKGQRARTALLIALAHHPDLLLLDEPSTGLDPVVRRDILTAIIRTVADQGRTVFLSSHLLDEVERVADDVAMIHDGKIVFVESLEKIKASHHRLVVRFEEPVEKQPRFPGAISCTGGPVEWACLCNGEINTLKEAVGKLGGRIVEEGVPTLDEIFVARIKG